MIKYEIRLITVYYSHSSIEEYEISHFHFNEIHDYLTFIEEHKKLVGGK